MKRNSVSYTVSENEKTEEVLSIKNSLKEKHVFVSFSPMGRASSYTKVQPTLLLIRCVNPRRTKLLCEPRMLRWRGLHHITPPPPPFSPTSFNLFTISSLSRRSTCQWVHSKAAVQRLGLALLFPSPKVEERGEEEGEEGGEGERGRR